MTLSEKGLLISFAALCAIIIGAHKTAIILLLIALTIHHKISNK